MTLERAGKFGIVSGKIKKLRDSFENDGHYKFPLDKTISIVCNLLDENSDSYEGFRNVFRTTDVSMIIDIALAKIPFSFGKKWKIFILVMILLLAFMVHCIKIM